MEEPEIAQAPTSLVYAKGLQFYRMGSGKYG